VAAALFALLPASALLAAHPVHAQVRLHDSRIESLTITSDNGLAPGATLRFDVRAAPEARDATVRLGAGDIVVPLRERNDGRYSGSYVVRGSDRLDPRALMSVDLSYGGRTVSRDFSYPPSLQAQAPRPAPNAEIERFVIRPMGRLQAGQDVRFRVDGPPRAEAWVDIPGVTERLALAETRPGIYEGRYTVRRRDDPDAFGDAVATLRLGNRQDTARLEGRGRGRDGDRGRDTARDDRPPQIGELSPANGDRIGERGRARIAARLSDEGSGIDPASVRLRLAGRDVTREARVTDDDVQYNADLPPGRYTADVRVSDRAGNTTTKSWTFEVVAERVATPPPPVVQVPPVPTGPLTLAVTSHGNGATVIDDGRLTLSGRTAPFADVRVQVDSLSNAQGTVGVAQKVLDLVVKADANGLFEVPVTPSGYVIPGSRYEVRMSATRGSQVVTERLTLLRRPA
jgi:hypothetical protein